jgi:hypothetical protein
LPYQLGYVARKAKADTGGRYGLWIPASVLSKSGRRDSNSQPSPWQGDVLPLNYTRAIMLSCEKHFSTGPGISQPCAHKNGIVIAPIKWPADGKKFNADNGSDDQNGIKKIINAMMVVQRKICAQRTMSTI